jgi:shikimate dehydrogenase
MSAPYAEVIGDPIAQSKSPAIHNFWLRKLGLDAEYRAQHVTREKLGEYLAERRLDPDWRGCNVTMPHKQSVMEFLDRLDPLADKVGAVNTIVRETDGSLVGFNTDVGGFLEPLQEQLDTTHFFRMARIIGTGGAARAIIVGLVEKGFTLVVAGRNPEKARALLEELDPEGDHHTPPLELFAAATDFVFDDRDGCFDLVVNASPLGMTGQPPLELDFSHIPPGSIAYDIVTSPLETEFLKAARAAGLGTVDGLSMLIGQAAIAFEKFFGVAAPRDDRDTGVRALLVQ